MSDPIALPPAKPFPGLPQAVLLLFVVWLGGILVATLAGVAAMFATGRVVGADSPWTIWLINGTGFSLALFLGWKLSRAPLRDLFSFGGFHPRLLVPLLLVLVTGLVLVSEVDSLLRRLPQPEFLRDYIAYVEETLAAMVRNNLPVTVSAVVLLAPLTEELFFRGFLLHGFVPRYGRTRALIYSALLFGIAHLTPNQLLIATSTGLLLGWLYLRTGTLWVPIAGHAALNSVAITAFVFTVHQDPPPDLAEPAPLQAWWITALAAASLILGLRWLKRWTESPAEL